MAPLSRSAVLLVALIMGFASVCNAQWGGFIPRGGLKIQPARIPARVSKANDTLVPLLGPGGVTITGGTPPYSLTYLQTSAKKSFATYLQREARKHGEGAADAGGKQFGMRYPFFATKTPTGDAILTRDPSVNVPRWYAFIPFPVAFTITDSAGKTGAGSILVSVAVE